MKAISLSIVLIVLSGLTQAQDYLISFDGTGASTDVNTVKVENLWQGTSMTMNGTDVLHLTGWGVGLENPENANKNRAMTIFPNPMTDQCTVIFDVAESDLVTIELFDNTGKQEAVLETSLECGQYTFDLKGIDVGIHTLRVKSRLNCFTEKIICTITGKNEAGQIIHPSKITNSTFRPKEKSTLSLIQMQYNDGEQLLITGYSGIYATVFPLVPNQSQTVPFNFVGCTDADGGHYPIVTIGPQIWMAQNLNVGARIDGLFDQTNNALIEKYCYQDLDEKCNEYGALYQWDEMMQYVTTPGVQGICPAGWHLPTDDNWGLLTTILGGESVAGGLLKETGSTFTGNGSWSYPNTGATNSSGFSALPCGYRQNSGSFSMLHSDDYFWSSTEEISTRAWYRGLQYNHLYVVRWYSAKYNGFSVRCVMN
jgi:uncharacterized protein (TIGR02145 family)